ncbi:MAG: hypothetical protein QOK43_1785 [Acidimicrobiaceae bacterium]|nr:hypothetical protein [Acidimicrobiaceae bacterium]
MKIVRFPGGCRVLLALAALFVLVVPVSPAHAVPRVFGGECTVSGSITFGSAPSPTNLSNTTAGLNLGGPCVYAGSTGATITVNGGLIAVVPGISCNSGEYTGKPAVSTASFNGGVNVKLTVIGPTATIVGVSDDNSLVFAGELATVAAGCPPSGSTWTGVLVVEDPVVE